MPIPKPKLFGALEARSLRPVTVSDTAAKTWHCWLRRMLTCKVNDFALASQRCGLLHRGTDFAVQSVRLFLQAASTRGWSAGVLFLDLAAAFDSVAREVVMGAKTQPADLTASLQRIGLDADVVNAMVKYIQHDDFLARAGVDEGLADAMRVSHHSTWFASRGCPSLVENRTGTRAGDPLGDLLFNLIFAALLREVRSKLSAAALVVLIPSVDLLSMLDPKLEFSGRVECFTDVLYVDDDAFSCRSPSAEQIAQDIISLTTIVSDCCGFRVNLGDGKTEALVALRGPRFRLLQQISSS